MDAMHPTLSLPIAIAALATLSCFAVKRRKHKAQPDEVGQQPEETAV